MIFKGIEMYALSVPPYLRWPITAFLAITIVVCWYFFMYCPINASIGALQHEHQYHDAYMIEKNRLKAAHSYHDLLKDISHQGIVIRKSSVEPIKQETGIVKSVINLSLEGCFQDFYDGIKNYAHTYLCLVDSIECTLSEKNLLLVNVELVCYS